MKRKLYRLLAAAAFCLITGGSLPAQGTFPATNTVNAKTTKVVDQDRLGPSRTLFYSVTLQGYAAPDLLLDAEYLNFGLGIDPVQSPFVSAALGLHWLLPFNPWEFDASYLGLSCDVTFGRYLAHPFGKLFVRRVSLAPMVSFGAYVQPFGEKAGQSGAGKEIFLISCQPLRFFSGDGYYTMGAFDIVLDGHLKYGGWGVRLFDFSYFFY
ncbi:MAG TPA: hypothetical protein PK759_07000 [Spirochaetales bacterium]|nr:hypothetical protein [Spirochaetales bacterium]HPS15526.1 hypothetical protein [Spirochaetales bacterium]